ncbi:hypothetical protein FKO01_06535 [Mesorhizobium sp. B2-3-3]|nr:hypothetical protein FKO01_06535 [Mesorhizobium sp. B2-3-3]
MTDPDAICEMLEPFLGRLRRVAHETGSLLPWLHPELKKLGLETRHRACRDVGAAPKTHETDALGVALIMRTGWFRQADNQLGQRFGSFFRRGLRVSDVSRLVRRVRPRTIFWVGEASGRPVLEDCRIPEKSLI